MEYKCLLYLISKLKIKLPDIPFLMKSFLNKFWYECKNLSNKLFHCLQHKPSKQSIPYYKHHKTTFIINYVLL